MICPGPSMYEEETSNAHPDTMHTLNPQGSHGDGGWSIGWQQRLASCDFVSSKGYGWVSRVVRTRRTRHHPRSACRILCSSRCPRSPSSRCPCRRTSMCTVCIHQLNVLHSSSSPLVRGWICKRTRACCEISIFLTCLRREAP